MWRTTNGNPMPAVRGQVNRLFDDFFGPAPALEGRTVGTFPALNVWEGIDELCVEAELPGIRSDELDISVAGQQLMIKGRRADFEPEKGVSIHRRERGSGEFTRVIELPVEVNANGVEATLADGVLLIMLPKAEAAKPRKIDVKSDATASEPSRTLKKN